MRGVGKRDWIYAYSHPVVQLSRPKHIKGFEVRKKKRMVDSIQVVLSLFPSLLLTKIVIDN